MNPRRTLALVAVGAVAALVVLVGCGDARRLATTPRTSAALYYSNYYAQHASDRRVRTCLGLAVAPRKPTLPVRCLMDRPR